MTLHAAKKALIINNLLKKYPGPTGELTILKDVSLEVEESKFVAVMGPSGSGKSTLLQCAAGLDRPTAGSVVLGGTEITALDEKALDHLRREKIGFIFQSFNLLPMLSVYENIVLPLRLAGRKPQKEEVVKVLTRIGMEEKIARMPAELSGGEQQRVAIARTLVAKPAVMFADEPTGSLDTATGRHVLELLRAAVDEFRQTVIMVTHDPNAASRADEVVFLVDGHVRAQLERPDAARIAQEISQWE